jgi:hypothetical protein
MNVAAQFGHTAGLNSEQKLRAEAKGRVVLLEIADHIPSAR